MDNLIHPTAHVEGDVQLGHGNVIGPYAVLLGPIVMGDDNLIGPHACIGTLAAEIWRRREIPTDKRVEIGNRSIVREHAAVQKPIYGDATRLGDDVYVMHAVDVAHDSRLDDGAVCAANAALAGVSRLCEGAYVAIGATVHQLSVIGHYAIVGASAAATRNVRPFTRHVPGQPPTLNSYAIDRYGFSEDRDAIERYVYEGRTPEGRIGAMVAEYEELHAKSGRDEYRLPG
jgi:UDP-N-acetylglucosamine acyltransferase